MKRQFPSEGSDPVNAAVPAATELRDRDERLSSMKALVGNLAHTFNNTLAPLAGYITLLGEEVQTGTLGAQYLNKLESSLHKSEGLISAILQATHPERNFVPKESDLTALLQRTAESWMKSLPAGAQISVTWELVPCTMRLDEGQWTKLVQNLLRNAECAVNRNGRVKITLEEAELTADEAARLGLAEGSVVQLRFEDSGCGMTDEVLQRACEPLFTTRPNASTAGLGLTFAHSVVQLHGGQLILEPGADTGTTVRIWLPRAE